MKKMPIAIIIILSTVSLVNATDIKIDEKDNKYNLTTGGDEWVNIVYPKEGFDLEAPLTLRCDASNNFDFHCLIFNIYYDDGMYSKCWHNGAIWIGQDNIIYEDENKIAPLCQHLLYIPSS
jgi:hypothetical protein